MKLSEARETVKSFVSDWPDEKLAQVFAFNQDGKMDFRSPCNCLIGVSGSTVLHVFDMAGYCSDPGHYHRLRLSDGGAARAEKGYANLGSQSERNRIFGEILSEVMAEREALRKSIELSPVDVEELAEALSTNARFLADMGLAK